MQFWKKIRSLFKISFGGKKVLMQMLTDYAKNTTIHGIHYLNEGNLITGLFWLISIVLSILGCSVLVYEVYMKWEENPVIVSVNEQSTSIWTIPFPAVTICPEIKFKSSLFNLSDTKFTDNNNTLTEQQIIFQNALYPVCPISHSITTNKKIDFAAEMGEIATPFDDLFASCTWTGKAVDCKYMFSKVLTDDGICYNFNMMNYKDLFTEHVDESMKYPKHNKSSANWSSQDGFKTYDSKTFPNRVFGSGISAGLHVFLNAKTTDIEYRCRGYSQGFKLALHSPNEIPRFSKHYTRIAFERKVLINVEPEVFITSDVLKSYKSEVRKCYFDGEKTLKYFKFYTKSNCDIECLTNFTQSTCGCVQFGMPFDNNTEICNYRKQSCASFSESSWLKQKLNYYLETEPIKDKQFLNNSNGYLNDCSCLPSCISIQYKAKISEGSYNLSEFMKSLKINLPDEGSYSGVVIYLNDDEFIAFKRSEFYGWTDFFTNCGGLFGLFMGLSILSLVEILYYCTFRWIVTKSELNQSLVSQTTTRESSDVLEIEDISDNNLEFNLETVHI